VKKNERDAVPVDGWRGRGILRIFLIGKKDRNRIKERIKS
jgi:hypothetical protein